MFSLDQVKAQSFYFAKGLQFPWNTVFAPLFGRVEVLIDMPVDGHSEGSADGGFFQKKRIKCIRYQQVIHKIFHGCNL